MERDIESTLLDLAATETVEFAKVEDEVLANAMSTITYSAMPDPS
jgi:hypothetical protein